ncbi:MAG: SDR family oxidoreductase [Actinomycetota bacterium]|nr:SDR family oxidoreductase [Actinomycetota bacterium]
MTEDADPPPDEVLRGEVAVVTGASRGIGAAVAIELARLGADVGLVQRGSAEDTRAVIEGLGRRAHVVRADLGDGEGAMRAVDEVADVFGRLDVAVANAGTMVRGPALELPLEDFKRTIDVNLTAVFAVSQAAARRYVRGDSPGRIVHIASVLSFQGGVNVCAYAASKGGVAQLTRALANEWAPLGIRVNAVAPGYVTNELTKPLRDDPQRFADITARVPAGRWAENEEVAAAVAWLASPAATYVHGHVLAVDGGWLAR